MAYNSTTDDVDLREVYTSFRNKSLSTGARFFKFILRNLFLLGLLFVLSFVFGYIADAYTHRYKSTIIVTPNFNTTDYLYEKVELLNAKITQKDFDFISTAGITKEHGVNAISITALPDIYTFVNQEENNLEVFKTLSENANAKDVVLDPNTSKKYVRHLIEVKSSHKISDSILVNIVKFLNNSAYYEMMRKVIYHNVENSIHVNEETIKQIDGILATDREMQQSHASVYISEDNKLNELLQKKLDLVQENHELSTNLYNLKYIVTPVSYFANMNDKSFYLGKLKFIFPFITLCLFLIFHIIKMLIRLQPDELVQ